MTRDQTAIFLIDEKNDDLAIAAYMIFTEDGIVDEDQMLLIRVFQRIQNHSRLKLNQI